MSDLWELVYVITIPYIQELSLNFIELVYPNYNSINRGESILLILIYFEFLIWDFLTTNRGYSNS